MWSNATSSLLTNSYSYPQLSFPYTEFAIKATLPSEASLPENKKFSNKILNQEPSPFSSKGGIILEQKRKRHHLEWIVTVLCCLFTLK